MKRDKAIKVLLIEDSRFATRHTQKMLAEAKSDQFDVELECVSRLSEGLEYLDQDRIDIVLLDLMLPDSVGWDTFLTVHTQEPKIPVVVMSGLEDEALAIEAVKKGAQDYLVKGHVDSNLLKRSILYAIERTRTEEELRKYREHLEELVEERTTKLKKTNVKLRKAYTQLEKQSMFLVQTEKMSAIGTLVAGVAHELNNPMMGILNYAQYCIKNTSENDRILPVLQDIECETRRCGDIVNNLLTFSHMGKKETEEYQKQSLNVPLERVLKLLSYRIEKMGVSVSRHFEKNTPAIWMKTNSIQEVFLNLITNALDALEECKKKEITIDVHREGECVQISVVDKGCGIAHENLQNIFDPFFTTKPMGKGTGLGLSLSQSIIKAHSGEITGESAPGSGTKFRVLLPINLATK
jgi:C4-dicarboxylate-specific signal transduction histidine kinase